MKIENITNKNNPVIYVLVGLPGSGKSTWISNIQNNKDFVVLSTDDEIEAHAKSKNLTYSQVFDEYIKTATSIMNKKFDDAVNNNKNIIWDQTNMSAKKRKGILSKLPSRYTKIAVVFRVDRTELDRRLENRHLHTGKYIPKHVVDSMERNFEMPTREEGFDQIHIQ